MGSEWVHDQHVATGLPSVRRLSRVSGRWSKRSHGIVLLPCGNRTDSANRHHFRLRVSLAAPCMQHTLRLGSTQKTLLSWCCSHRCFRSLCALVLIEATTEQMW